MSNTKRFEFSADVTWREWGLVLMCGRPLPWSTSAFYIKFCVGPVSFFWAVKKKVTNA